MRLAFVDIAYGYTAGRPDTDAPLGGTTSAICFLARELAKRGVVCSFFNRIDKTAEAHGIKSFPLDRLIEELADPEIAAVIFCGRWLDGMVELARQASKAPFIAWMHESSLQTKLTPPSKAFDGIVYVSEWQQRVNRPFALSKWKQAVIRNAMNPRAANLFPPGAPVLAAKQNPPVLLYAGGAARGVVHLPPILEDLRKKTPDFSMEIFCNTDPSGHKESDEQYIGWLRSLPSVAHVGMVGQPHLIERMKRASFLVSPNPWPETSCIAMIEALAAGLEVVTTDRAALPETASGFARHIHIEDADDPVRFDMPVPPEIFADAVFNAINARTQNPGKAEAGLRKQIDYFHAHYQWTQRVEPWMEFIKGLK